MAAKVREKNAEKVFIESFAKVFYRYYRFVTKRFPALQRARANPLKCRLVADPKKVKPDEFLYCS